MKIAIVVVEKKILKQQANELNFDKLMVFYRTTKECPGTGRHQRSSVISYQVWST